MTIISGTYSNAYGFAIVRTDNAVYCINSIGEWTVHTIGERFANGQRCSTDFMEHMFDGEVTHTGTFRLYDEKRIGE